ncbi:ATP-binding protein [Crenothrix polyspora]|uniref:histidine kinase n=1 Tax=Crenothrix polyspora TaxID=360316 RepID=A0A1R4HGN7_9GAMM|nr:ATP-binding protein [Crenothrix polyspora]SJM95385.1 Signal transduction histidine kinase [Crenothrix polyspora]
MEHYFYDSSGLHPALTTHYHPGLVFLSLFVLVMSGFAVMSVIARIKASRAAGTKVWCLWLLGGSLAAGMIGWTMHFIGMLALEIPINIHYDITLTLFSIIPSALGCAVALFVLSCPHNSKQVLVIAGLLVGLSFGGMHFTGMAAIHGTDRQLSMLFEPRLFALAGFIATFLPVFCLFICNRFTRENTSIPTFRAKATYTLSFGFTIAAMHYVSVAATRFIPGDDIDGGTSHSLLASSGTLAFVVALVSIYTASLVIWMAIVDSRIQQAAAGAATSRLHMREAIESIADGFSLYDTQDRLIECNQRYRELMGNSQGILLGMTYENVIRNAAETNRITGMAGHMDEWLKERLSSHRTPRGDYIENFNDDRWIRVSERRIWDIGTVAIYSDITELKVTEIELFKAMDDAEKARQAAEATTLAKSVFLAHMSHELRTPLNAVIGYSELLMEETGDNAIVHDLQKILAAGQQLLALINEILDLSKVETGKMELSLEDITLPAVIQDIINTIKPMASKNANTLMVECPECLPLMRADLTKLRQGVLNLLSNACKFTRNGRIILSVATESFDGTEGIVFRVADNGIGMNEEQVNRVFDAFTQADSSTTRRYGGTGLGLTITKKFCEIMGGKMSVDSKTGIGSTFTIWLPLNAENSSKEAICG